MEVIIVMSALPILIAIVYLITHGKSLEEPYQKTLINEHGLKYQFVRKISEFYNLRFYDDKNKKWVYVMWNSIDFDWYGTEFDYREYDKRSFDSNRDNTSTVNWYESIKQLNEENEYIRLRVIENNKKQDEYVESEKQRKIKQGYWHE